jgi:hypothetical protein
MHELPQIFVAMANGVRIGVGGMRAILNGLARREPSKISKL